MFLTLSLTFHTSGTQSVLTLSHAYVIRTGKLVGVVTLKDVSTCDFVFVVIKIFCHIQMITCHDRYNNYLISHIVI